MDQIVGILNSLHVDSTFFYQFAIFFIFFLVLKAVFFSKLLFVIEQREQKTTKLEATANKKFHDAEKLAQDYKDRVQNTNVEIQELISVRKSQIMDKEKAKIKTAEEKINDELERKKTAFNTEISAKRSHILGQTDELAKNLVDKLV